MNLWLDGGLRGRFRIQIKPLKSTQSPYLYVFYEIKCKIEILDVLLLVTQSYITKISGGSIIWSNSAWAVQIFGVKLLLFLDGELSENEFDFLMFTLQKRHSVYLDAS